MVSLDVLLYLIHGLLGKVIDHKVELGLLVGEREDLQS